MILKFAPYSHVLLLSLREQAIVPEPAAASAAHDLNLWLPSAQRNGKGQTQPFPFRSGEPIGIVTSRFVDHLRASASKSNPLDDSIYNPASSVKAGSTMGSPMMDGTANGHKVIEPSSPVLVKGKLAPGKGPHTLLPRFTNGASASAGDGQTHSSAEAVNQRGGEATEQQPEDDLYSMTPRQAPFDAKEISGSFDTSKTTEQSTELTRESASETLAEILNDFAVEPVTETAIEPVGESAAEPVHEMPAEWASGESTEPVAEPVAETAADAVSVAAAVPIPDTPSEAPRVMGLGPHHKKRAEAEAAGTSPVLASEHDDNKEHDESFSQVNKTDIVASTPAFGSEPSFAEGFSTPAQNGDSSTKPAGMTAPSWGATVESVKDEDSEPPSPVFIVEHPTQAAQKARPLSVDEPFLPPDSPSPVEASLPLDPLPTPTGERVHDILNPTASVWIPDNKTHVDGDNAPAIDEEEAALINECHHMPASWKVPTVPGSFAPGDMFDGSTFGGIPTSVLCYYSHLFAAASDYKDFTNILDDPAFPVFRSWVFGRSLTVKDDNTLYCDKYIDLKTLVRLWRFGARIQAPLFANVVADAIMAKSFGVDDVLAASGDIDAVLDMVHQTHVFRIIISHSIVLNRVKLDEVHFNAWPKSLLWTILAWLCMGQSTYYGTELFKHAHPCAYHMHTEGQVCRI